MPSEIPIIDLFAGPGGLSEGFSAQRDSASDTRFRVALSIEKDVHARETLRLRSFYRQFEPETIPDDYYRYLRGEIDQSELFARNRPAAERSDSEAWLATLGQEPAREVERRIAEALDGAESWVLLGGPPCQAYSLVGRSRMRRARGVAFDEDPRHFLYKEYLRILRNHQPAVFVFENVKGLLSSKIGGFNTFEAILRDLECPSEADVRPRAKGGPGYALFGLDPDSEGREERSPSRFVVRSERFGVPQRRHRIIVIGIRENLLSSSKRRLSLLTHHESQKVGDAISDLPPIRSRLSGFEDSSKWWALALRGLVGDAVDWASITPVTEEQRKTLCSLKTAFPDSGPSQLGTGARFIEWLVSNSPGRRLGGVVNHESKSHMASDLQRYRYVSMFARVNGFSPKLDQFPPALLPNHRNARRAAEDGGIFVDRFRVQLADEPSTTVTSHLAKDGHYFIHPDPAQARSLTVREAARLQTFPDDYFFEGPRTEQYAQVGNAVPPYLSRQISSVVGDFLSRTN